MMSKLPYASLGARARQPHNVTAGEDARVRALHPLVDLDEALQPPNPDIVPARSAPISTGGKSGGKGKEYHNRSQKKGKKRRREKEEEEEEEEE